MWASVVVAAIALAAAAYMLRFLMALLFEDGPSICYLVLPSYRELDTEKSSSSLRRIDFDEKCRATEVSGNTSDDLLGKRNYVEENYFSGRIVFDVRSVSNGCGGRTVFSRGHRL